MQRQAAIDAASGEVISGIRSLGRDGFYYVRARGDDTAPALLDAAHAIRTMPGDASAEPLVVNEKNEAYLRRGPRSRASI